MAKRTAVSKKTRFEVFKRDSFACQYCGQSAPEVILEVDHIIPVSKGGDNDVTNLITSCFACNRGKSNKKLSNKDALTKQKAMLDDLQDRREQLEMMAEWKNEILQLEQQTLEIINNYWSTLLNHEYSLTGSGLSILKKHLKKYSVNEIFEALDIAHYNYVKYKKDTTPTEESIELAFEKLGGILYVRRQQIHDPKIRKIYYICGILKNKFTDFNRQISIMLLKKAVKYNANLDSNIEVAKEVRSWNHWKREIELYIKEHEEVFL
jgi:hypothetical protein